MPSGRTHDSITLWSLPFIAGIVFVQTRNSQLTLIVSGSFLFSGLMFGPDLDIYSQQYKRWGLVRWIWLPYRKSMRHRSLWSHGLIVGTVLRVVYLSIWIGLFFGVLILGGAIAQQWCGAAERWESLTQQWVALSAQFLGRSLQQHPTEWVAAAIGLELGSLSHSFSDWAGSSFKRWKNRRKKRVKG